MFLSFYKNKLIQWPVPIRLLQFSLKPRYYYYFLSDHEGHVKPFQKLLSDPRSAAMTTTLIRALQPDYHCRINWSTETDTHIATYQVWEVYVYLFYFYYTVSAIVILQRQHHLFLTTKLPHSHSSQERSIN